jgi:cysteine desulfurase / selenocysteine lyase
VVLKWIEPELDGSLDPQKVLAAIGPKTKLIAITHMSNVLGTKVDVAAICNGARAAGVPVLVDGSQAAVHGPVDVAAIGCDFYAITGHKLYGPSGSGAIYIKRERMQEMRPFLGGGDMIREVSREVVTYAEPPLRFEAGTPGIVQQIGLGVALDYLMSIGMDQIAAHESALRDYAQAQFSGLNWLSVHGQAAGKGAIFSLAIAGQAHAHDISTVLDKRGIAVRAGTHCAMPLMEHLGITSSARASFGMYNTTGEVDALVSALELCHELFG